MSTRASVAATDVVTMTLSGVVGNPWCVTFCADNCVVDTAVEDLVENVTVTTS